MANTLTGLIPHINDALTLVSRELVGAIPAVTINSKAERAAKNQNIVVGDNQDETSYDITPGVTPPDDGDNTTDPINITISKEKRVPIRWNGNEELELDSAGITRPWITNRIAGAMRVLANEMEVDLLTEIYKNSSRAWGTSGTNPFASSLENAAQLRKILDDNGAPGGQTPGQRSLIINTTAGASLRSLANLSTESASGTTETLRQGTLLPLYGFDIKESAGVQTHTKGTGTGYDIVAAGEAVGQTTLSLEGGNSGTILAGDVAVFTGGAASDTNKYVITSGGTASGAAAGDITIAKPGLLIVKDTNDEMTIQNNYVANVGFSRDAVHFATRFPARPKDGDLAVDVFTIRDPLTGLAFEVSMYKMYRQIKLEVASAWGQKVVKSAHIATLLG